MTATSPSHTSDPRRWRILGLVGIAQLMLILDVTVVAIALPHIGAELDLRREALTWVVSGYILASDLAEHGYQPDRRTFFVWEAVTQYLTEDGVRKTFDFLATTHPGSHLVFTYIRQDFLMPRS